MSTTVSITHIAYGYLAEVVSVFEGRFDSSRDILRQELAVTLLKELSGHDGLPSG